MSKKTIISDFNALKGRITLSETTPSTPAPAQPSTPKAKPVESSLKVGQSVVLMDSDLRGNIISLGKRVSIELEDGLMIEAAY